MSEHRDVTKRTADSNLNEPNLPEQNPPEPNPPEQNLPALHRGTGSSQNACNDARSWIGPTLQIMRQRLGNEAQKAFESGRAANLVGVRRQIGLRDDRSILSSRRARASLHENGRERIDFPRLRETGIQIASTSWAQADRSDCSGRLSEHDGSARDGWFIMRERTHECPADRGGESRERTYLQIATGQWCSPCFATWFPSASSASVYVANLKAPGPWPLRIVLLRANEVTRAADR